MKKAIVIGATSGIGRELAKILSHSDYKVGVTGRRVENLYELKNSKPDAFEVHPFDCYDDGISEELKILTGKLGGLDLLILSSGTGDLNENLDFNLETPTIDLNVTAFTEIAGWAYKYFEKQGYGHFVAISSIGGLRGSKVAPAYNASKAYQISYLEGLRQKAHSSNRHITITDIRPGLVDTDMAKGENLKMVAPVDKAVKQIFKHIRRKKDIAYVTKRWKLIAMILKFLPNFLYKRI